MRNKKSSIILLIVLIVTVQLPLVGFMDRPLPLQLRNVDSKNRLVKIDALIGGSGMPDPAKIPQTEQNVKENQIDKNEDDPKTIISTEIRIKVRGETILINDGMVPTSSFNARIAEVYDKSKQVILIDDYADYQTYRKVLKYFENNGIKVKEETVK